MSIDTTGLIANIYQNGEVTGGVTETSGTWQQYTYTFTASSDTTQVAFLFRQDPAGWGFDDVSVTAPLSSTNLIANPGFEDGSVPSHSSWPNSWSLIAHNGINVGGGIGPYGAHSGTYGYSNGDVGEFSGLAQTVATTSGVTYTLTFWLQARRCGRIAESFAWGIPESAFHRING